MAPFRLVKWKPVQLVLYGLFRLVAMLLAMFPYYILVHVGRVMGRIIRILNRKHAKRAAMNLEHVGYSGDIPRMVRRIYEHLARSAVEIVVLPRIMKHHGVSRFVRFHGLEVLDRELRKGKGVIAVIAHHGNWEIVGLAFTMLGYPLKSLARPIENEHIEKWVLRTRTSTGQVIIAKHGALRQMMEALKSNHVLVIQADQDAKASGVVVKFLGQPASTVRSPALLSLKYGAPVLAIHIYRDADGVHHARATPPIYPGDFAEDPDPVKAITQEYMLRFEQFVREHPEQWLWLHPRWRSYTRGKVVEEPVEASA